MKIKLTVVAGPNQGRTFSFEGHDTFIVGRGAKAHLQLPPKDKFFSRHHFLLEVNPPLCRLTDLASSNGTFVNGNRVTVMDLKHGDVITGGDTSLRIEINEGEERPTPRTLDEQLPSVLDVPAATRRESLPDLARPGLSGNEPTVEFARTIKSSAAKPGGPEPEAFEHDTPRLGDYRLLRKIGAGGMGAVHLVEHVASRQRFAIKTIAASAVTSERAIQRFLREASILAELQHPHIVGYREVGRVDQLVFFAMEFVEGPDAAKILLQHGPIAVPRAVNWVCQLLSALEYAHAQQFVHRDIKPANLLIAQEGGQEHLKLADFGLARVYHASTLSGLTMDGDVGGSLPFMPPEQITNYRNVDPRSDLYSVGATLHTLVCGKTPYQLPKKSAERMKMILQSEPKGIRSHLPDLPPKLADVIDRSLAREAADRFANAAEMRRQLLPFSSDVAGRSAD